MQRYRSHTGDWQGMQLWTQLEIRQGKDAEIQIAYGRLARHAIVDAARDQARERMQRYRSHTGERQRLAKHAIVDALRFTEFLEDERQRIARIRTQETPGMRYCYTIS